MTRKHKNEKGEYNKVRSLFFSFVEGQRTGGGGGNSGCISCDCQYVYNGHFKRIYEISSISVFVQIHIWSSHGKLAYWHTHQVLFSLSSVSSELKCGSWILSPNWTKNVSYPWNKHKDFFQSIYVKIVWQITLSLKADNTYK